MAFGLRGERRVSTTSGSGIGNELGTPLVQVGRLHKERKGRLVMFQEKAAMFIYCVSPVHMGAGTALGAIDNPIQRERHTQHPMMMGSGIKGALRHFFSTIWADHDKNLVNRIFGPETGASEHAGAIGFSDAQIVLFPVRSLRNSFVYATCPTALARLKRLLSTLDWKTQAPSWEIPQGIEDSQCVCLNSALKVDGASIVLESYQFTEADQSLKGKLELVAEWIATNALPDDQGMAYFRSKIKRDTVLLSDNRFNYFAKNATVVEPHVRINDETGTADDGGLFYTENLPPESLLVSLAMASVERKKKEENESGRLEAEEILEKVRTALDGEMVQMGGDATTGRGQVVLKFVESA